MDVRTHFASAADERRNALTAPQVQRWTIIQSLVCVGVFTLRKIAPELRLTLQRVLLDLSRAGQRIWCGISSNVQNASTT